MSGHVSRLVARFREFQADEEIDEELRRSDRHRRKVIEAEELSEISDRQQERQDEIARLETKLEAKDEEIDQRDQDLKQARDVSNAAQQSAQGRFPNQYFRSDCPLSMSAVLIFWGLAGVVISQDVRAHYG